MVSVRHGFRICDLISFESEKFFLASFTATTTVKSFKCSEKLEESYPHHTLEEFLDSKHITIFV